MKNTVPIPHRILDQNIQSNLLIGRKDEVLKEVVIHHTEELISPGGNLEEHMVTDLLPSGLRTLHHVVQWDLVHIIIMSQDHTILDLDILGIQILGPKSPLPQSYNLDKEARDKRHNWTKMSAIVMKS